MDYRIRYAAFCIKGFVRSNNEDNWYIDGQYFPADHEGLHGIICGEVSTERCRGFAVFDGMGGEACGEMASFLAADAFGRYFSEDSSGTERGSMERIRSVCEQMNRAVCTFASENRISSMGTTVCLLTFSGHMVSWGNLGDSRIYRLDRQILRISEDHVERFSPFFRPGLTQFLGIPEEEMALEPSGGEEALAPGLRYLLCTDGVTDLLGEAELYRAAGPDHSLTEAAQRVRDRILHRGATDNATAVLCEVVEGQEVTGSAAAVLRAVRGG